MQLSVAGSSKKIGVNQLICLGTNYREHADEMKVKAPSKPMFFLKSTSSLIQNGEQIVLPKESENVHHEVELAIVIGADGKNIRRDAAMDHVFGYAVFNDVTARDIQTKAREKGLPWTLSKSFDTFGPISSVVPKDAVRDPHSLELVCIVNGETRQRSNTTRMIFYVPSIIEYLSSIITLKEGDIIATGTPSGVSRIVKGDTVTCEVEKVGKITNPVV